MGRQVIGVIAESYEDFRKYIDPLIDRSVKPETDTKRMYRTADIWYHAVISIHGVCGITFNDVFVTDNAYKAKRIPDILEVLKPTLYPLPYERTIELIEIFDKLETDYKSKSTI